MAGAHVTATGSARAVCLVGGSLKLTIVAEALKTAVADGISDEQLAGEASALVGAGQAGKMAAKLASFTKACELPDTARVPSKPSTCKPAAKGLVPVLRAYDKLEADWAAAVS